MATDANRARFSAAAGFSPASNSLSDTWCYLYKESDVRDGNYQLIERFEPALRLATAGEPLLAAPGPNPQAWQVAGDTPWVAKNTSDEDQTLQEWGRTISWPKEALTVHPGEDGIVVVRWRSSANARVDIAFSFADAYPAGGGDGIAWYVELDDSSQTLASGDIERGGAATGSIRLDDVEIARGSCIHFVVDSKGDHACDWTRLDAEIVAIPA